MILQEQRLIVEGDGIRNHCFYSLDLEEHIHEQLLVDNKCEDVDVVETDANFLVTTVVIILTYRPYRDDKDRRV